MSALAVLPFEALDRLTRCKEKLGENEQFPALNQDTIPRPIAGAVPVPGISRPVEVKIASRREEWEQAFRLVANKYQACGYDAPSAKPFRFTAYHALPETTTFVAKEQGQVLATLSLVQDNDVLGLPMETIYASEINALRQEGRQLVEVTSLADRKLHFREFVQVFTTLMRVSTQYGILQGADTWVIAVNPRNCKYYQKILGFVPVGSRQAYPAVQNNPALALALTVPLLEANAPTMYKQIFGDWLPEATLTPAPMPAAMVGYFAAHSSQTDRPTVEKILEFVDQGGSRRRRGLQPA